MADLEVTETPQMLALQEAAKAADEVSAIAQEMLERLDNDPTLLIGGALDGMILALESARLAIQRAGQ